MRVVDRKTFLGLPAGTVFMKTDSTSIAIWRGNLEVKDQTWEPDEYLSLTIFPSDFEGVSRGTQEEDIVLENLLSGTATPLVEYDNPKRDGLYEDDQLFLVWEKTDHQRLLALLLEAFDSAYGNAE